MNTEEIENICEYCNEIVDYPLPIHGKCAEIWLRGYNEGLLYSTKKYIDEILSRKVFEKQLEGN